MNNNFSASEIDRVYNRACSIAVKALEKEFCLHCCGTGCRANSYIEMIALSFQVEGEFNIDEARRLILSITNRYIQILNEDLLLRPLMVKYPFDQDNVDVALYFRTKQNNSVFHPKINTAYLSRGKFNFCTVDKSNPYPYKDKVCETYSEALEKVGFTKPNDQSMFK